MPATGEDTVSAAVPVRPSLPRRPQATQRAALVVAWASVAACLAGFLLPWVRLDLRGTELAALAKSSSVGQVTLQLRRHGQVLKATLPSAAEFPRRVRGIQIPRLLRQDETQVAVALLELLTDTRQHLAVNGRAVFLVPAVALACGLLVTRWNHRPAVAWGVALLCAAVAALGFWRLLTVETTGSLMVITVERGLWLSLWAYVGLAVSAGWLAVSRRGRT